MPPPPGACSGLPPRRNTSRSPARWGSWLAAGLEVLASSQAILDSPILGHGSWAKDFKYVDLLTARLSSLNYEIGAAPSDVGLIPAHSYLLGSWVWAGLLGGVFWLAILLLAGMLLVNLYAVRLGLAPLLVFSTALLTWNVAFSPYSSSSRLLAMYGIALCLLGLSQVRRGAAHPAPSVPFNEGLPLAAPRFRGSASDWNVTRDHRSAPGHASDRA